MFPAYYNVPSPRHPWKLLRTHGLLLTFRIHVFDIVGQHILLKIQPRGNSTLLRLRLLNVRTFCEHISRLHSPTIAPCLRARIWTREVLSSRVCSKGRIADDTGLCSLVRPLWQRPPLERRISDGNWTAANLRPNARAHAAVQSYSNQINCDVK